MTQNEMIVAIYGDMQELKTDVRELKDKVQVIEGKVQVIEDKVQVIEDKVQVIEDKVQVIEDKVQALNDDVQVLKGKVQVLEDDTQVLKDGVRGLQLTLENETNKNIRIIAEGHLELNRKLDDALKVETEKELMQLRVNVLENDMRRVKEKVGIA